MDKSAGAKHAVKVGDEAVAAKTGKKWAEWFKTLDAAGAKKLDHKGIVAILRERHGVGSWWQQMVTVAYEQARGLRKPHQKVGGYSASASKTIGVPVMKLFDAWLDEKLRRRWLPKSNFEIRKGTPGKSLRITWSDKKTNVDVGFFPKGPAKSQVAVQHDKLPDAKAVARMKIFWGKALEALQEMLTA